jgi:hypothetical protein
VVRPLNAQQQSAADSHIFGQMLKAQLVAYFIGNVAHQERKDKDTGKAQKGTKKARSGALRA